MVRAGNVDVVDAFVRTMAGFGEGVAHGGDGQDAAAGGDQPALAVPSGAGMDDVNAVDRVGDLDAVDDVAGAR